MNRNGNNGSQNSNGNSRNGYDPDQLYTVPKNGNTARENMQSAANTVGGDTQSQRQTQSQGQTQSRRQMQSQGQTQSRSRIDTGGGVAVSNSRTREVSKLKKIRESDLILQKSGIDRIMLIIILILVCFGAVMVFSASYSDALDSRGDSFYYIKRHLVFALIGAVAITVICTVINYRVIRFFTPLYFLFWGICLVAVLFYGVAAKKAVRWLPIMGFQLQPSEFMKLALILMLAYYIEKNQAKILDYKHFWASSFWGVFVPLGIIGSVCLLIALEFHFSGVIIMFLIGLVVAFVGGARPFWIGFAGVSGGLGLLAAILFTDYAKKRIDIWLHPENYSALSDTWQTIQGRIAVGSGGLLGVGLGQGRQKYLYVSEPQNDFIFSIICEELGFIGALLVILLFALFVWRGIVIAMKAPDTFASLTAIGIVAKIAIQAILNMCVVTAVIPNTGITLPFFSYGGSALISTLIECGVLLSISRYSYQEK